MSGQEKTLHYSSPGHGGWGVVRIGMLAPESIQLFICPSACGRHGAIGAMRQGLKKRLHYLYVSQSDIIKGYDDLIPDAVSQILRVTTPRPKVFFLFVSCLDDLIGTDHMALLSILESRYPDIRFAVCHMNPISLGSKTPPPVSIQNNLYDLLEPSAIKYAAVNAIGNLEATRHDSEIYEFLKAGGIQWFRHISDYESFDSYQEMAGSQFNLVLGAPGRQAAERMQGKLGIPWAFLPITYDPQEIEENYGKLTAWIFKGNQVDFDLEPWKKKAQEAIAQAREAIGDLPIIVDASAVAQPFGLAKALLNMGFSVARVEAQECMAFDRAHREWLIREHPEVELCLPEHHRAVLFDRRMEQSLAIGVEGAYLAGSRYFADLFNDGGMFGYGGLIRLMEILREAVQEPADLEQIINGYGLVV